MTQRFARTFLSIALFGIVLLSSTYGSISLADDASQDSLRNLATQRGFFIGAAVMSSQLNDPTFADTLSQNFNMIVAENDMKPMYLQPSQGNFTFTSSDKIVDFALKHNMEVRGHCLVWHQQIPNWLNGQNWTRDELLAVMREHITQVVSHYRGKVKYWDVVNEGIEDNGSFRNNIWYQVIGKDYIEEAFKAAHEADPDAELYYNDYGAEGSNEKAMAIYRMVKNLKKQGVPIHGVGLQMHIDDSRYPLNSGFKRNIKLLTKLGLKVQITEMDVRLRTPASEKDLKRQREIYHDITEVCLEEPNVTALVTWGVTDRYSWIPKYTPFWPGTGEPLLFDVNFNKKPAYFGIQEALKLEGK